MAPQPIVDSHVHLFPLSDANAENHAWMAPVPAMLKSHDIKEYIQASTREDADYDVQGIVFVEVDRNVNPKAKKVEDWAWGPLKELRYLKHVVEGENGGLVRGIVPWAPVDRGIEGLMMFLDAAQREAGEETWARVKGFRFLLQGLTRKEDFKTLTDSSDFIEVLREFGDKEWTFDLGIDQRRGGTWQLEEAAKIIERAHHGKPKQKKVTFILNHLCKPEMLQIPTSEKQKRDLSEWKNSMERFATFENVYVKLSGAFSEMGQQYRDRPMPVADIVKQLKPWADILMMVFSPSRIMFGSDWPVCNIGGPGDELSWTRWKNAVSAILNDYELSAAERDRIWYGTAVEAYRLSPVSR